MAAGLSAQVPSTRISSTRRISPISAPTGQILQKALAQADEVDVEHHHHEQEQHRHRADVDHDQDHRQELGADQHEQPGAVEERENQEQHRVHGVARRDDHDPRGHRDVENR